ncbi:hypothetical protein OVA20_00410 [Streptomyces sp. SL294]|uniref:hypothetical protein n=2 Tax=unclassified Streptomyces TaxID=2593676 RepID=UPI002272B8DF|nr:MULTISPECIES: hypothetical protein [unclassified Streptomyces]MCY1655556.1 hypothetical protein [Streptomyces sp. SL203]MCY1676965.1 hypothetical protein [Streptomyces sp. SL294]
MTDREMCGNQGRGAVHGPAADRHPGRAVVLLGLAYTSFMVLEALQEFTFALINRLSDLGQQARPARVAEVWLSQLYRDAVSGMEHTIRHNQKW